VVAANRCAVRWGQSADAGITLQTSKAIYTRTHEKGRYVSCSRRSPLCADRMTAARVAASRMVPNLVCTISESTINAIEACRVTCAAASRAKLTRTKGHVTPAGSLENSVATATNIDPAAKAGYTKLFVRFKVLKLDSVAMEMGACEDAPHPSRTQLLVTVANELLYSTCSPDRAERMVEDIP